MEEMRVKVPMRDYTIRQIRTICSLVRATFDELGLESPSIVVTEENPYYILTILTPNAHLEQVTYDILSRITRDVICSECGGTHYESDCPHVQIELSEYIVNQSNDWYRV